MDAKDLIYQGNARVYLQGKNALLPIVPTDLDRISYYLGEKCTNLIISDYRHQSVNAANRAIATGVVELFPYVFNQPANIVINSDEDITRIELYEGAANEDDPILWMGILSENYIPIHFMMWQKFIDIEDQGIAFAALISE